jgi:ketosteroid isomerase-like protein
LPVASIPPYRPPEQGKTSVVSSFEVFADAIGGVAALANGLPPCAATVDAAGAPDIFAVGRVPAVAAVDNRIPLILAVGRAAAKKVWAAYFADPSFTISWKTVHAGMSKSGDLGFTTGTYEDSYKAPDGKVVTEKGKYVCIWKKQKDGSWKAIHDIWNSDSKQERHDRGRPVCHLRPTVGNRP